MDFISNWDETKKKIIRIINLEKDEESLTLRITNIQSIIADSGDPYIDKFMEIGAILASEVIKKIFNVGDVDTLPIEIEDQGDISVLKFKTKKLFMVTSHLLEAIFLGDIVKEIYEGNQSAFDDFLKELS
ncbi:MAG: hypothetical protein GF383_09985 [Candidatus Lokiarchaeota archaeon]|nr:hypothetical protein [Candidatus Lokiarchaeota archaeon]MBD3340864.1 hypothetical protein [Candidatus Lokiarchaeota archaeon]